MSLIREQSTKEAVVFMGLQSIELCKIVLSYAFWLSRCRDNIFESTLRIDCYLTIKYNSPRSVHKYMYVFNIILQWVLKIFDDEIFPGCFKLEKAYPNSHHRVEDSIEKKKKKKHDQRMPYFH